MAKRNSQAIAPVERVLVDENERVQTFPVFGGYPIGEMTAVVDTRHRDAERLAGRLVAVRVSVVDLWPHESTAADDEWLLGVERVDLYWLGKRAKSGAYPLLPFRLQQTEKVTQGQHEGRFSILGAVLRAENLLYMRHLSGMNATDQAA